MRLWEAATGSVTATLTGHTDTVTSAVFRPDGGTLATNGSDRSVRLWDVATGIAKATFSGYTDSVEAIAFSHDGRTLVTASDDGSGRLWEVGAAGPEEAVRRIRGVVGRDLTPDERARHVPGSPVGPVCPV
ncbi:WD40 repeat domain-containing protein [Yinghuangia sp. ASG 101]|uniref:WD40 repeat domain-containing protein n=1 Tax=Yinghuangia sp. ASG 101 TaxID=2896848 RepID=UPI001E471EB4|nr:WD40 repeat domain-containing protein [Yinghuangia sp. ASG 101]UGQ14538.1 WD40 repeat domain-containing protein [Yinghuangia sp. ASG 101]